MLGYAMLGTNDHTRAKAFYDAVLGLLGGSVMAGYSSDKRTFYTSGPGTPMLAIGQPNDGKPASVGNGAMMALPAKSRAVIDACHAKALELGGSDEGAPGVRGPNPDGFYAAYFRDPDGNKLCVFRVGPA